MKRHFFILIALLTLFTLFSCADNSLPKLSNPIQLAFDINTLLGLNRSNATDKGVMISAFSSEDPSQEIIIDGKPIVAKLIFSIIDAETNIPIEEKTAIENASTIQLFFKPIVVGTTVFANLAIETVENNPRTLFSSQSEPMSIKKGENKFLILLTPPLLLWDLKTTHISGQYATPEYSYFKTPYPIVKSAYPIQTVNDFCLGSNHTTHIILSKESNGFMYSYYNHLAANGDVLSETVIPDDLINSKIFIHNNKPMLLGYERKNDEGVISYILNIYDIEANSYTPITLDDPNIKISTTNDLYPNSQQNKIVILMNNTSDKKNHLITLEESEDNLTYNGTCVALEFNIIDDFAYQFSISDFTYFNGNYIALCYYKRHTLVPTTETEPVSFGYIAVINPTDFSITKFGEMYISPSNPAPPFFPEEDMGFLHGPRKFIGITNTRLFIADSGYIADLNRLNESEIILVNYIVTMNKNFELFFQDANTNFTSSLNTDPPA